MARSGLADALRACVDADAGAASAAHPAFVAAAAHLASLTPSALDADIRSLALGSPEDTDGVALVGALLRVFAWQLRSAVQFELAQAHLSLTLQAHGALIDAVPSLQAAAASVARLEDGAAARLREMLDSGLCAIAACLGQ
jgi:hypothetical protein